MAVVPQPEPGKLLRWKKDGSGELENVTIAQFLADVAGPSEPSPTQQVWIDTSALFLATRDDVAEVIPINEAAAHTMAMQEGGKTEAPTPTEAGTSQQAQTSARTEAVGTTEAATSQQAATSARTEAATPTEAATDSIHQPAMVETGKTEAVTPTEAGASQQAQTSAPTEAVGVTETGSDSFTASGDSTAPSVGTLTVPDTTGTSITGIGASATDAVGVTAWMIKEQAADSGWTPPAAGDAGWNSVTPTTSFSSSSLTFTSSATATGTRYFRIYFKDAAGNVGGSATDSATITIASYMSAFNPGFESAIGSVEGDNWWPVSAAGMLNSSAVAERRSSNPSPIAGSYSGYCEATGFYDSEYDEYNIGQADLWTRWTKAAIDATNGRLRFKMRWGAVMQTYLNVLAYTSGGTQMLTGVAGTNYIVLAGGNPGSANMGYVITPSIGTVYDFDVDLLAHINARFSTGSWATVSKVLVGFTIATGDGTGNFSLDTVQ